MRKLLLYSALLTSLFSSCKKEHNKAPDVTKHKVTFNVSGFTQQILGSVKGKQQVNSLQTNTVPLDTAIGLLYYQVYDANGAGVSFVRETAGTANFGVISDALAAGTYTVVFAGGDSRLTLHQNYTNTGNIPYITESPTSHVPWGDTFFKKLTLTVTGGDITQTVSLDRVVSKLTINLEDALPANAAKITVSATTEFFNYNLLTANPGQSPQGNITSTFSIPPSAIGTVNFKTSILIMNTYAPVDVVVSCYDSSNKLIGQATISQVVLHANEQTILSGKLFGTDTNINTGLNNAWDPTPITINF